eukprot:m.5731 g.5731  ORF g.5731 m.5731 type:complete len:89 (-) comp2029_c0_seq1:3-269(-)
MAGVVLSASACVRGATTTCSVLRGRRWAAIAGSTRDWRWHASFVVTAMESAGMREHPVAAVGRMAMWNVRRLLLLVGLGKGIHSHSLR